MTFIKYSCSDLVKSSHSDKTRAVKSENKHRSEGPFLYNLLSFIKTEFLLI